MAELTLGFLGILFFFILIGLPVLIILNLVTRVYKRHAVSHPNVALVDFSSKGSKFSVFVLHVIFGIASLWLLHLTLLWKIIDELPTVTSAIIWTVYGTGMAILFTIFTLWTRRKLY